MYLKITPANALNSGAQLWFIPKRVHSSWTSKIDWYLGFQLTKNLKKEMPTTSNELKSILNSNNLNELNNSKEEAAEHPVFIAPQKAFPIDLVVKYNSDLNLENWVEQIKDIWKDLKNPSLRVFLPYNIEEEDFLKRWNEEDVQLGIVTSRKK